MKLGELFVKLGFDVDDEKLEKFEKGIKSTAKNVLALKAVFAGAVYGLDRFVDGTTQAVASLENINQQTGLSIELLQKWQKAGQLSNLALSAEQISGSIVNLQKLIAKLKLGGTSGALQTLGVDAYGKDAFQLLEKLRERVKLYSPDVASDLLSQVGIDPGMLAVLKLSREEFDRLGRNDFLTEKGRNAILASGKAIRELKLRFVALKDQIALQLSPALLKLLNGFFKWIISNKTPIINSIKFMAKWIGNFFDAIKNSASLVGKFISDLLGLESGVKGLGIAFAILLKWLKPVWFRIGLIIGVLDDIKVWRAGGEAMFGSLYEWVSKVGDALDPLFEQLSKIKDIMGDKAIMGAVLGFGVGGVKGAIMGAIGGGVIDLAQNAKDYFVSSGQVDPSGRTITNNNSASNKIEINIQGSDNPQETARTVKRELEKALGATGNSFSK